MGVVTRDRREETEKEGAPKNPKNRRGEENEEVKLQENATATVATSLSLRGPGCCADDGDSRAVFLVLRRSGPGQMQVGDGHKRGSKRSSRNVKCCGGDGRRERLGRG